jgi:hypothetical protein
MLSAATVAYVTVNWGAANALMDSGRQMEAGSQGVLRIAAGEKNSNSVGVSAGENGVSPDENSASSEETTESLEGTGNIKHSEEHTIEFKLTT